VHVLSPQPESDRLLPRLHARPLVPQQACAGLVAQVERPAVPFPRGSLIAGPEWLRRPLLGRLQQPSLSLEHQAALYQQRSAGFGRNFDHGNGGRWGCSGARRDGRGALGPTFLLPPGLARRRIMFSFLRDIFHWHVTPVPLGVVVRPGGVARPPPGGGRGHRFPERPRRWRYVDRHASGGSTWPRSARPVSRRFFKSWSWALRDHYWWNPWRNGRANRMRAHLVTSGHEMKSHGDAPRWCEDDNSQSHLTS